MSENYLFDVKHGNNQDIRSKNQIRVKLKSNGFLNYTIDVRLLEKQTKNP